MSLNGSGMRDHLRVVHGISYSESWLIVDNLTASGDYVVGKSDLTFVIVQKARHTIKGKSIQVSLARGCRQSSSRSKSLCMFTFSNTSLSTMAAAQHTK